MAHVPISYLHPEISAWPQTDVQFQGFACETSKQRANFRRHIDWLPISNLCPDLKPTCYVVFLAITLVNFSWYRKQSLTLLCSFPALCTMNSSHRFYTLCTDFGFSGGYSARSPHVYSRVAADLYHQTANASALKRCPYSGETVGLHYTEWWALAATVIFVWNSLLPALLFRFISQPVCKVVESALFCSDDRGTREG